MNLPRFYPILDAGLLFRAGISIEHFARELREAGIRFLQYRDKDGSEREVLERAALLRRIFPASDSQLILNDRLALVVAAGFDGVHLGQEDLSLAEARALLGTGRIVGYSTHNQDQLLSSGAREADYVAIGPVFATVSKENPDPIVGTAGVRSARGIASKPLVAIGGITRVNASEVFSAGADSVAVISDLLPQGGESIGSRVQAFLRL